MLLFGFPAIRRKQMWLSKLCRSQRGNAVWRSWWWVWRRCGTFFSASRPAPRSPSCYTAFCQVIVVLLSQVIIVLSVRSHRPLWSSLGPCRCRHPIISVSLSLSSFKFIFIRLGNCRFCYRSLSPLFQGSFSSSQVLSPCTLVIIFLLSDIVFFL